MRYSVKYDNEGNVVIWLVGWCMGSNLEAAFSLFLAFYEIRGSLQHGSYTIGCMLITKKTALFRTNNKY